MDAETALAWVENLVFAKTGEGLNTLQKHILQQVWQGRKYPEIAAYCGYTEGHVKDVGSHLWRVLSQTLGEKINKINCRAVLERCLHISKEDRENLPISAPVVKGVWGDLHAKLNFVGRTEAIAHLDRLVNLGSKAIVIQGEGGLGKTTLAQQYLQNQNFEVVLELLVAKETQNLTSAERVVEEWLKQDLQEEPGLEFGVTLGRLKRQLQARRIGVLIDNLEPALDRQGRLIESHRNYVELFRILTDPKVQSVTLITSRDRLCEPSLNVEHYRIPGLDLQAWQEYYRCRQVAIDSPTLQQMHQAYGGNAKVMGILCGTIQTDFAGDAIAYWQENHADPLAVTDLKNLIASQFHRLRSLDPPAYHLLCRLGCYRYQDVAKIPTQGVLDLLWDIPNQQRQIITALRDRCLIEFQQGEYWLHPAIRAEAIARLRASDEWIVANCKAAEFWTNSVPTIQTTKDALQALEAYYHYVEINDFELAARVILKSRNNQWGQYLPLGGTLYRMGLIQPVLGAITQVIQSLQSHLCLGELYNILGDLYWTAGKIHAAIECQEKTIDLATQLLQTLEFIQGDRYKVYYLKMLEVDSLLSMGLYNIDLWDLETAAALFQQVIDLAQNTTHHRWAEKASACLALVNSYLGSHQTAYNLAEPIYGSIMSELNKQSGSFAYFIQILGQTYVNLGNRQKAQEMFSHSLTDAEKSHYLQIKAKTLNGLAECDRQQSLFELALNKHVEAIEILEQIGAKCDLAEACFQLGLTYAKMKDIENSQLNYARSLQLFTQMNAPRQVEKVLRAKGE